MSDRPPEGFDEFVAADRQPAVAAPASAAPPGFNEFIAPELNEQKYGGLGQQALTAVEGAAHGFAGPVATAAERALSESGIPGLTPADQEGRASAHPVTHYGSEAAGLVAPAVLSGGTSLLAKAGVEGLEGLNAAGKALHSASQAGVLENLASKIVPELPQTAGALSKIGNTAARVAIENMGFQGGEEVSKMINKDPNQTAGTVAADIGLAGLLGGAGGAAIGSISPLWKAAESTKLGGLLKALVSHAGGIDGTVNTPADELIERAGLTGDIAPDVRARLVADPEVQQMSKILEQSDTTKSGLEHQANLQTFRKGMGDALIRAMGSTPEAVEKLPTELSKYESGKAIGHQLASEYQEQIDPIVAEFEKKKAQYAGLELPKDQIVEVPASQMSPLEPELRYGESQLQQVGNGTTGPIDVPVSDISQGFRRTRPTLVNPTSTYTQQPGAASKIADGIAKLAHEQGWTVSPSSDIMREVNRAISETKNLTNLKELTQYATQIGENTASTLPFGQQTPLSRAGMLIKGVLRDAENEIVLGELGKEGPAALERYQAASKAYSEQAKLKDALDSRLGTHSSTAGFAKGLRTMAQTDGEAIVKRLSGVNDADLLQLLQSKYPKTAALVRENHIAEALKAAAAKAGADETINAGKLLKHVEGMSPEVRNFVLPPEAQGRVNAIGTLTDQLNKLPHNFSNTARTMDKLMSNLPATAVGLGTLLSGHNPAVAALLGGATKALSRDVPDATRLAFLKFLGSKSPIEGEGFKAMTDYIHHAMQGEKGLDRAVKAVLKPGSEALINSLRPSDNEKQRLDKRLKELQKNPAGLQDVGGKTGHYLPEHAQAIGQTSSQAMAYLNSIRPESTRSGPFDPPMPPSTIQKAKYDNALAIAQRPTLVLAKMQQGSLTVDDVNHLRSMYPALADRMASKIYAAVNEHMADGQSVPYKTRLSMALFLGQPLDSTMTPQAILAAQSISTPGNPGNTPPAGNPGPKKSTAPLSKVAGAYRTPAESREARQAKV